MEPRRPRDSGEDAPADSRAPQEESARRRMQTRNAEAEGTEAETRRGQGSARPAGRGRGPAGWPRRTPLRGAGAARPRGVPQFGAGSPASQKPPPARTPRLPGMESALRTGLSLQTELRAREPLPTRPPGISPRPPALVTAPPPSTSVLVSAPRTQGPRASRRLRDTTHANPGPEGRPRGFVPRTRSGVGPETWAARVVGGSRSAGDSHREGRKRRQRPPAAQTGLLRLSEVSQAEVMAAPAFRTQRDARASGREMWARTGSRRQRG